MTSLVAQSVKNLPVMQETWFALWVGKILWRKEWLPTLVFLPGEFHGQRSLASYTPWGHKELDTTEGLTLFLFSIHSVDFSGDNFKANLNLF